ncbi:alpha/beta hydrolase [Vulcanimicrobium alpinum]|nr:alpha/beta hydrolase [Vulcanimicrobium alpinum]
MQQHTVVGGGGLVLRALESGDPQGVPVLFLHGWSQRAASWERQLASPALAHLRLVALDLRGHGESEKPASGYDDGALWAADVAATLDALDLHGAMLTGWSYGGYVIADYLRHRGQDAVGAIHFVSAGTGIGIETPYRFRGNAWNGVLPAAFSDDAGEAAAAMRTFERNCFAARRDADERAMHANGAATPGAVRKALFRRRIDNDDVMASIRLPTLVTHGDADRVIDIETGRHIAAIVPGARLSVYAGIGHVPFWEDQPRFDAELAAFAAGLAGRSA